MFVLGHLGFTALAGLVLFRRLPLAWLLLGAILPDLVDKPLGLMAGNGYGRLFAHTLLFAIALLVVAAASRKAWASALAVGVLGHLALDRLWLVPEVLLWPFLGAFPEQTWSLGDYAALATGSRYVLAMEALGAAALALVGAWEWRRRRRVAIADATAEVERVAAHQQ